MRGATAVEYAVVVSFIAVIMFAAYKLIGDSMVSRLQNIADFFGGS